MEGISQFFGDDLVEKESEVVGIIFFSISVEQKDQRWWTTIQLKIHGTCPPIETRGVAPTTSLLPPGGFQIPTATLILTPSCALWSVSAWRPLRRKPGSQEGTSLSSQLHEGTADGFGNWGWCILIRS